MHKKIWHHTKRIAHHTAKKTGHILFPWMVHFLTDKYQNKHHHVVVDTIFSLCIIVLIAFNIGLGYWFFLFTTPAQLNIKLDTPTFVISGSEITYYINYHNVSKDVDNVNFTLIAPSTFTYTHSNLEKTENSYYFGELDKYKFGEAAISGEIIGRVNEWQKVSVIINYRYHGQEFSQIVSHSYQISDSSLEITTELPESILNNQEFTWYIHYKNNSNFNRDNINFILDLPDTLAITSAPEQYNKDDKKITLINVEPWAQGDLEFKGIFSKAVGESDTFIRVVSSFDVSDIVYAQTSYMETVEVLTPRMSINSSAKTVAGIGEKFYYRIDCSNIGDVELTNVKVSASVAVNQEANIGLYASSGSVYENSATWIIDSLLAGETKSVYLTISTPYNLRKQDLAISMSSSALANISDLKVLTYSNQSTANTKFNSTLDFENIARYYDNNGEQIGYGPYPLVNGEITAVSIFWNLRDFTNDLHNVTIVTTLPSQVEWTNNTAVSSGANISYNPATREVIWHTSSIPAFAGPQGANFEVRILPNNQQIGTSVNLTNSTRFSAQDAYTNSIMIRDLDALKADGVVQ
ncbi:MAG: hypothetical protein V1898_01480 [Patescibacteria group bacterium]